jgi:hypothetical protein
MRTLIFLSVVSSGLSIMSCAWSLFTLFSLHRIKRTVGRVAALEESVVRSVLEEGGTASVEAVLRTAERLPKLGRHGMEAIAAYENAVKLHRRQV